MQTRKRRYPFLHQYTSAVLIFVLFLSQTIQVSFFDRTEAATTDYRDVVSIIIDEDSYSSLRGKVRTYAADIQGYLKNTRVSVFVAPANIRPEVLAAHNEKLYYEGDGKSGVSKLVGTIIIGNVPIPVVHKGGLSFPSLYPYVDFDDKQFVFDTVNRRYVSLQGANGGSDVDIWHGVINPSVGGTWNGAQDIPKIAAFFDKTHDFYTRSGKFTPLTAPPRVFYYDGYAESLSTDPATMYKYALFTQNVENIAYKRWGKYLLQDIVGALSQFSKTNTGSEDAYAADALGMPGLVLGDESLDPSTIASLPDIQTATPIMSYLKQFYETINKKTLSDIQKFVHNAGRYNDGTLVRVDQGSIQVTLTDQMSMDMLHSVNDAIEKSIDNLLTSNGYARRIPILDSVMQASPMLALSALGVVNSAANPLVEYRNYYFGREARTITSPEQCTIARGWSGSSDLFKRPVLTEANAMYDVNSTAGQIGYLTGDTDELVRIWRNSNYACFTPSGTPKIQSYFGGNSLLRLSGTNTDPALFFQTPPAGTSLTGFSLPIASLAGQKETTRFKNPSLSDCQTYQYTLLQPHLYSYTVADYNDSSAGIYNCQGAYPNEWSNSSGPCSKNAITQNPRFTCNTEHISLPNPGSLEAALAGYSAACTYGSVSIDGKYFTNSPSLGSSPVNFGRTCITGGDATNDILPVDTTQYQNRNYHSIPSLLKHVSPTADELAAAELNGATPSLPVDAIRTVEFLTPKGNQVRLTYPNFFEAPTTSIADVRSWLKTLGDVEWNAIITRESSTSQTAMDSNIGASLGARALPASPIDWNTLVSDEVIEKVIRAKRALASNVTKKYQNLLEASLSYSHSSSGDILDNPLPLPGVSEGYEIAYLGLTPFTPKATETAEDGEIQDYQYQLGEMQGLNFTEPDPALSNPETRAQAECGPPDGVPLFQWPASIQCWIKTLFPIKITPGFCGSNTIGIGINGLATVAPPIEISRDSTALRAYYANMTLVYSVDRTMMQPNGVLDISYYLVDPNGSMVQLPPDAFVSLDFESITSGGRIISPDQYGSYMYLSSKTSTYTNQGSSFILSSMGPLSEASLSPNITIPLPDGTYYQTDANPLTVRVSDEYVEITPLIDGVPTSVIDTTSPGTLELLLEAKLSSGTLIAPSFPYTLDIYDDISGELVASGITINGDTITLPSQYRDYIGVYRFVVIDGADRVGESTLAVRSGPIARMEFIPVSSVIVTGSESLGVLRLLDAKGNLITPNLLRLTANITGGAFVDAAGASTTSMQMDTTEGELVFRYTAGAVGALSMNFSIADPSVATTANMSVITPPRVRILRSATPQVGGDPTRVDIEIVDPTSGALISGFSSLATIDIPQGAGSFDKTTISLSGGRAESVVFTPGRIAGDHIFSVDIAGIGKTSEKQFNILPGVPMYIDGSITDTQVEFSLRDRYGNLTADSPSATLKYNQDVPKDITFTNGKYTMPRVGGYWKAEVPALSSNTITYVDSQEVMTPAGGVQTNTGTKTITGIPYFQLYVPDVGRMYSFRPDYNARYTVLAGDAYLSEASQLLYEITPGQSQSLAATTLLTSPYEKETLFSVYPGGGFSIGTTIDTAIEVTLRNRSDTLSLEAFDRASQSSLAHVAYPLRNLSFSSCTATSRDVSDCSPVGVGGSIMFVTYEGEAGIVQSDANRASIIRDGIPKVTYERSTGLALAPGVTITPVAEASLSYLVADVEELGIPLGRLIFHTADAAGVVLGDANASVMNLTLDQGFAHSLTPSYSDVFSPAAQGLSINRKPASDTLDERLLGPSNIDSFGAILDVPGVGWHSKNRTLLSFAAGDTVGEATKWFHTYTMINLGDPVAHVDRADPNAGISAPPDTEFEGVDRSIGTQIASSSDRFIQSYKHSDMNNDELDDIIVIYNDGFLELYLNMGGTFRKKEKIAYIPTMTPLGIEFGDFTGDNYADIIALDNSGALALVDNSLRRMKETPIVVSGGSAPGRISQYKVYDMDNDTRDDIVYLTESGELGILYGTATAGAFTKNVVDPTLGVSLSGVPENAGGAIRASTTPTDLLSTPVSSGATDIAVLNSEVFYTLQASSNNTSVTSSDTTVIGGALDTTLIDPNLNPVYTSASSTGVVYVKTEYASAYGLEVKKLFTNLSASTLRSGDRIAVEITVKNTGTQGARNITYLDRLPKIFDLPGGTKYRVTLGGASQEKDMEMIAGEEYDFLLRGVDIPSGQTLTFSYEVLALPTSYGTMIVDNLERNLTGDDPFGDIGFESSTTCGADMVVWSSTAARNYLKGTRSFTPAELSPDLAAQLADANGNGIPDSMEYSSGGTFVNGGQEKLRNVFNDVTKSQLSGGNNLMSINVNPSGQLATIGFNPQAERQIESVMKNLADGLGCGFGGGGCISSPINWAPLAPGNAISLLGSPVGRSPAVNQGIPIFSALTRLDIGVSPWCVTIPMIWPVSPLSLDASLPCSSSNVATAWGEAVSQLPTAFVGQSTASTNIGAGGVLGTSSSSNFLRIFVSPTLTMGMGTAICMGPATSNGPNPLFPLIPKGNCIVLTKSLPVCKGDGSAADGDVTGVSGLGTTRESWNGQSCTMKATTSFGPTQQASLTQDIVGYLKNQNNARLNSIYSSLSNRGSRSVNLGGPLLRMGDGTTSGTSIEIGVDSAKPLTVGNIVKVNNKRISGFPEYIMDWVGRQTEELTNKLFTLPNLIIYTPKTYGPNTTGDLSELTEKFSDESIKAGLQKFKETVGRAGDVNVTDAFNKRTTSKTNASSTYNTWLDQQVRNNASTINSVAGGANQWRQAWKMIAQVPFVRVEQVTIPINIPWLLPQDLDRYARSLKQYEREFARASASWCAGKTARECADIQTSMNAGGVTNTIKSTLKRIEEWRRFPEKLQKYITWKQRYVTQILCNIDILERMIGGWYRDNGLRFKKWAEFYVLIRTIAETWQPFLDLWRDKDRSCAVCQNQRWNLDTWKIKMISAVIPQLPILQFPRWPDIVLDLSDIKFGVLFRVPDFRFNISPIRLPDLPALSLPSMPSIGLNLGLNFNIPPPPSLPNLPDLPSLPNIKLPNLPPPPKLPKLFGAVSVGINIFKLYSKIMCYKEKTVLIPEDYAGATIAQRTDRQGTLPFDFLNIRFPQVSIPSIREIRISTHVNFQVKSDFLVEFARAAVKPLNSFNTDLARMPRKFVPDINLQGPNSRALRIQGAIQNNDDRELISALSQDLQTEDANSLVDIDTFIPYLRSELLKSGMDVAKFDRSLSKARYEADTLTRDLEQKNKEGFRLLREYLHAEEAESREMEKVIDRMTHPETLLSHEGLPFAAFTSNTPSVAKQSLARYTAFLDKNANSKVDQGDDDAVREMHALASRMTRLIGATGTPTGVSTPLASGYSPKFEGIYILSPNSKTQTRLFDYTDLLDGTEKADLIDIDKDGDIDYLYMIEGALYIKYSHLNNPSRPIDLDITTGNIDTALFPEAPNYFSETIASPAQISVSFQKADANDASFRLEFFDRYLEWDRVQIAGADAPDTPRTIIDFTPSDDSALATIIPDYTSTPVARSLETVSAPSGFLLEGMQVATLVSGQAFRLSSGRPLYTGNSTATLSVTIEGTNESRQYSLDRFSKYVFPATLSGTVTTGKSYVLTPSGTEKLSYTDAMRGMPLLPGTRIINTTGNMTVYNPIDDITTTILAGVEFRHIGLSGQNDSYSMNFPYPNGYYSARLRSLRTGNVIRAGVTLMAPLAGLDLSAPVIDIGDQRIPVYQSRTIPLVDAISEVSNFSLVADPDVTLDTNANGGFTDDFTTTATGLSITASDLIFGGFDTLGTRTMNLSVTDGNGNNSTSPINLDIYAPIPQIVSVSTGGVLTGALEEQISGEPIHLFRVRQGEGVKLVNPAPLLTDANGKFSQRDLFSSTNTISVTTAGNTVNLSSRTGLPLSSANVRSQVVPASANAPLKISFTDTDTNTPLFTASIVPPSTLQVMSATATGAVGPTLRVEAIGGTQAIPATLADPSIPGGMYVVAGTTPVVAIDMHGQIYLLDSTVTLKATEENGKLVIIASRGGFDIAKFLYMFDFFVGSK